VKTVEKVGGGVKALCPEAWGQGGLDQKGAHDVIRGPNHALRLAVLWRSVRTGHTQLNTSGEKEGARGVVIELTTVVTLDGLHGEAELSGHPGKEVKEGGEGVGLGTQRESPRVVREIIDHDQVVLVARNTRDRRSPEIAVNKIKGMRRMRRRRKRKTNMATQLTRMVEMLIRSPSARKRCTTTELSQSVAAGVTKPAVPSSGRGSGSKSSCRGIGQRRGSGSRKAKGVKGSRTIAPEERTSIQRILHSEPRRIEFNRTRIVSCELTNRKEVVDHLRSDKDIGKTKGTMSRTHGSDRKARPITNHDRRWIRRMWWSDRRHEARIRGGMVGGTRVGNPLGVDRRGHPHGAESLRRRLSGSGQDAP
jgi:hypothetical protein